MASDSSCSSFIDSAIDKLWFYQNILEFEPHVVGLQSMLTRPKSVSPSKSSDENTNRQATTYSDKKPPRLTVVAGQPLFQLPTSSSSTNKASLPNTSKRKPIAKSRKSLSELERYELEGFMDLGFTFPNDKPSSHMTSMAPGLQRHGERDGGHEHDKRRIRRPYLSEAWLVNNPSGSPFVDLRMLPKSLDGDDMKKHIKFWAKRVADVVLEEH